MRIRSGWASALSDGPSRRRTVVGGTSRPYASAKDLCKESLHAGRRRSLGSADARRSGGGPAPGGPAGGARPQPAADAVPAGPVPGRRPGPHGRPRPLTLVALAGRGLALPPEPPARGGANGLDRAPLRRLGLAHGRGPGVLDGAGRR